MHLAEADSGEESCKPHSLAGETAFAMNQTNSTDNPKRHFGRKVEGYTVQPENPGRLETSCVLLHLLAHHLPILWPSFLLLQWNKSRDKRSSGINTPPASWALFRCIELFQLGYSISLQCASNSLLIIVMAWKQTAQHHWKANERGIGLNIRSCFEQRQTLIHPLWLSLAWGFPIPAA